MAALVADLDHFVDHGAVENFGHEAGADALDLVRPGLAAGQHRAVLGLDGEDAQRRPARLEHLPDAGDGAAGADAGNESVDRAVGIGPDFLGRGAAMDFGIGGIAELLRNDGVRRFRRDLLGALDRAVSCPAPPA